MDSMFNGTTSLSDSNKGLIHSSFSSNSNWPYDWSAHVTAPPPNQTGDNNQSNPPVDNGTSPPVDNNQTLPYPAQAYVPIVVTLQNGRESDGSLSFSGMTLTDGGSPILERGFLLSPRITFQTNLRLPSATEISVPSFSAQVAQLDPGKLYYYRAYARNSVGENYGSIKKFRTPEQEPGAWWAGMPEVGAGWRNSDWFGTFRRQPGLNWIYHAQLGWAFAVPDGSGGLWLWMRDHRWAWTQQGVFPYLWKHQTASWQYLLGTQNGQPVFYDWTESASNKLP